MIQLQTADQGHKMSFQVLKTYVHFYSKLNETNAFKPLIYVLMALISCKFGK